MALKKTLVVALLALLVITLTNSVYLRYVLTSDANQKNCSPKEIYDDHGWLFMANLTFNIASLALGAVIYLKFRKDY